MYARLYSGPRLLEELLTGKIYDLVQALFSEQLIDKFYFVRYHDDGYHLRLRFHLTKRENTGQIILQLCDVTNDYVGHRLLDRVVFDTYNRELERYGAANIEDVETLFSINSLQVISILRTTPDYTQRWLQGVRLMDQLLRKFGLTLEERAGLYESYFNSYTVEFDLNKPTREALKKKYRLESRNIESALSDSDGFSIEAPLLPLATDSGIDGIIKKLMPAEKRTEYDPFLKSIMHMHYNRLFRTQQRFHEFVLYYLLGKTYRSLHARNMQKITSGISAP